MPSQRCARNSRRWPKRELSESLGKPGLELTSLLLGDFDMSSAENEERGGFAAPIWDDATDDDKRSYLTAILGDVE
jgi:hypothetical protein